MGKRKGIILVIGIILLFGLLVGKFLKKKEESSLPSWWPKKEATSTPQSEGGVSFEESRRLAEEAVKNASTYKFDGFDLKFESSEPLRCPSCWEFAFSFKSRSAGYGDRSGKLVAQVITPHIIRVTLENGKITSVVTDRTFDELTGRYLK